MENSEFSINENSDQIAADATQRGSSNNTIAMSMIETGEPGRLTLYRSVMQETSRKITSSVTKEELVGMFEDIPSFKEKYSLISYYYNVLSKHIHDQLNSRVEEHIKSAELRDKFEQLEELIKSYSANSGTTAWRPSRNVESNLRSYIVQERIRYRDQLKELVALKESAVHQLKFDVMKSRNKMKNINERLEDVNEKFLTIANSIDNACRK